MPAIQPARLKFQIVDLLTKFDTPKQFISALKDLFEFYADRTRKAGRTTPKYSLARSFNVPKQVTKQVLISLKPKVEEQPEISLQLADLLWQEGFVECRMIAFAILGWMPPSTPERIKVRLIRWCQVCGGDQVSDEILAEKLVLLWKKSPNLLMALIEFWLSSSDPASRRWGLRIIPFLVKDPSFNNLPIIFRLLTPFVQGVNQVPGSDLVAAIRGLAQYASQETAYFLQRSLTTSENPGIYVLIRQSMDVFSPSTQMHLRSFLREMRELFDRQ